MDNTAFPKLKGVSVTVVGLSEMEGPVEEIEASRLIFPAKPSRLASVIGEVVDEPA